jgi:hypothetical protein
MKSTPESRKQQLIADLVAARREVLGAAMALRGADRDARFLGTWSAHDIVAHLVGWDDANREAIDAVRSRRLPAVYAHYDHDWRTFNAGLVEQHKRATLEETVALAETSHEALLATLVGLSAADVSRDYGVRSPGRRRVTIAMLIAAEAQDENRHAQQIREFLARRL